MYLKAINFTVCAFKHKQIIFLNHYGLKYILYHEVLFTSLDYLVG